MLNQYFKQTQQGGTVSNEKNLLEDLIIESIRQYGFDTQYLPRTYVNEDNLFGEDPLSTFDSAPTLEMYIKNVEGMEGEGDIMGRFGIEMRDQMTLTVARKRFDQFQTEKIMDETGSNILLETSTSLVHDEMQMESGTDENYSISLTRPREHDLIFFPMDNSIYEVKFVEHRDVFYQLGNLYVYDLRVELFDYSHERINTGNSAIDVIETTYSGDMLFFEMLLETGDKVLNEDGVSSIIMENYFTHTADNQANNTTFSSTIISDDIIDFSERNPFGEQDY